MGSILSAILELINGIDCGVLLVGLDAAGKTTMLNALQNKQHETTLPTVGFQEGSIKIGGATFHLSDVGGQQDFRNSWVHFLANTPAIIFVVDSHDRPRIEEAKNELHNLIKSPNIEKDAIIAILANKQDLPDAMSGNEIEEIFEVNKMQHRCKVFETVITMSRGIEEVFKFIKDCRASR